MRRLLAMTAVALVALSGCFGNSDQPDVPANHTCPDGTVVSMPGMHAAKDGSISPADAEHLASMCPAAPLPVEPEVPTTPFWPSDGASEMTTLEIPSVDAHMIPVTVYRPLVANATQQVPVLLHSHGFTGKRAAAEDQFKDLVGAGFGVVSFDERGHGESKDDSTVYFMHPDYEVQDVIKVVDLVSTFDWVLKEDAATAAVPNDPVLGAFGGSYGGAFQLMGAIFDPRFDAIVPEIAWSDITEALAPNGAVKSGWVDLFYGAGNAQDSVKFSNDFHVGFAYATTFNQFPAGQYPGVPDLYTRLKEASPVSYPTGLTIPTLFIQGMPDTLFPLNQAVQNLQMMEALGLHNTTALYTHLGGHILSVNSLRADTSPVPVGLQGQPGGKPCGQLTELQVAWHQHHLLGRDTWTGPRVCLSLEDETTVTGATFPLAGTEMRAFDIAGPLPVVQAPAGPGVTVSLIAATEDVVVAGIPTLTGTITAPGADTIVYFSLRVPSRGDAFEAIVDDQVVPLRVAGPNTAPVPFSIDLGGVGVRLKAGEELVLTAATVEPMYFGNAERIPGGTVLQDLQLLLPIVPADAPSLEEARAAMA